MKISFNYYFFVSITTILVSLIILWSVLHSSNICNNPSELVKLPFWLRVDPNNCSHIDIKEAIDVYRQCDDHFTKDLSKYWFNISSSSSFLSSRDIYCCIDQKFISCLEKRIKLKININPIKLKHFDECDQYDLPSNTCSRIIPQETDSDPWVFILISVSIFLFLFLLLFIIYCFTFKINFLFSKKSKTPILKSFSDRKQVYQKL